MVVHILQAWTVAHSSVLLCSWNVTNKANSVLQLFDPWPFCLLRNVFVNLFVVSLGSFTFLRLCRIFYKNELKLNGSVVGLQNSALFWSDGGTEPLSVFQESTSKSGRWTWKGRRSSFRSGEPVLNELSRWTETRFERTSRFLCLETLSLLNFGRTNTERSVWWKTVEPKFVEVQVQSGTRSSSSVTLDIWMFIWLYWF